MSQNQPVIVSAYGVTKAKEPVKFLQIERRALTAFDVLVKILYSGICHSDKHHIYNDWGDSHYPLVPGHEIVGVVEDIGANVTKFKIGDKVAIGNMTDSCKQCLNCEKAAEQYCLNDGPTWVYNSRERVDQKDGRSLKPVKDPTFGGYSTKIVAQEDFVFAMPDNLDLARSASLLCAGITMYYPLKYWKIGKGHKVGIAGIGGLGHLGIKFAKALDAEVVALTTSTWKLDHPSVKIADDAVLMDADFNLALEAKAKLALEKPLTNTELKTLEDERLIYKDYFDIIIDTIPVSHDVTPYLRLLRPGQSKLHIVGNMNDFPNLKGLNFVFFGKDITSSNVGGTQDTREMLQFCAENNIQADIQLITPGSKINDAIGQMVSKQASFRFVIDMSNEK